MELLFSESRARAAKQPEPLRSKNLKVITYLENLSEATGRPLKGMKVSPFIARGARSGTLDLLDLNENKNELNRIFFAQSVTLDHSVYPGLSALAETVEKKSVEKLGELEASVTRIEREIRSHYDYVRNRSADLNAAIGVLNRSGHFKQRKNIVDKITLSLDSLHRFYTFLEIKGEGIIFITKPVYLAEKNLSAGVDYSIPMGRYIVTLNAFSLDVRVRKELGEGKIHPYVQGDNQSVCFGNLSDRVVDAQRGYDINSLLYLLRCLLTTYSNESVPYHRLYEFKDLYEKANGPAPKADYAWEDPTPKTPQLPF